MKSISQSDIDRMESMSRALQGMQGLQNVRVPQVNTGGTGSGTPNPADINTVFEGAEVFVKIGIKKWDAHRWENAVIHWIPCGYFTIDEPPRALSTITISALDRMILFDKTVP